MDTFHFLLTGFAVALTPANLLVAALEEDQHLDQLQGYAEDSGEGRWTVQAAVDEAVAAPVITAALFSRFRSRSDNSFGEKLLSAMRKEFGGHVESVVPERKARDEDK